MASDVRTPLDLEDRPPLATLAANVLQNARNARAPHIDGTAKRSNKRLRGDKDPPELLQLLREDGLDVRLAAAAPCWPRNGPGPPSASHPLP